MRCPKCAILVPFNKAPTLTNCAMCGTPFIPQIRDVLEFGKFNIAKEIRPTQIALGQDVEDLLQDEEGGVLFAEGGTGIGKSFAYLIPALLAEDKRVIIATAKKTLQDQLANKDVPFLIEKMERKLSYSLYKGKSNYGCWKLAKAVPPEDRERYNQFISQARVEDRPADIANWRGARPWWWSRISVDNCVLKKCEHAGVCKPAPKKDNIVITNHHLLALDMRIGPGSLLGPYNLLIIDEAHQAPEAYRSAYSHEVTFKGIDNLLNMFKKDDMLRGLVDDLGHTTTKKIEGKLGLLKKHFEKLHITAQGAADDSGKISPAKLSSSLDDFSGTADALFKSNRLNMEEVQRYLDESINGNVEISDVYSMDEFMVIMSRMKNLHRRYERLLGFAEMIDSSATAGSATHYITTMDERGMKVQPLNIGGFIGPNLRAISHKIIMSATLAMGNDFSYSKNLFGIGMRKGITGDNEPEKVVEKIYASPFDLDKQAIMYLPRHLPLPAHMGLPERRERWIAELATEIAQLVGATQGDAFVLFSAKADMREVLAELGPHVWANLGVHLVVQDGEATAALDEYKEHKNSVLFGLKSFWEGVDIPGDRLKLVVISKLPFPNPKDPIVSALCEVAGRNSFMEVMVPRMVFDMKQGVGRLIRTQSDRGFVAILDVRVWTGTSNEGTHAKRMKNIDLDSDKKRMGYGKKLLDTLGYRKITDDFTILQTFVKKFFKAS